MTVGFGKLHLGLERNKFSNVLKLKAISHYVRSTGIQ